MVIIDVVATPQEFGVLASQNISECSFQKVGHDQICVGHPQHPRTQCSSMKLALQAYSDTCFINNNGLTLTGILAKIMS
jgi:hypothetical protein